MCPLYTHATPILMHWSM